MAQQTGRNIPLSLPRRWIGDLLHFAGRIPTVPVERTMDLSEVQEVRRSVGISWPALFLKAFGLAAQKHPQLRQAFLAYPWSRLYEHSQSVASVAIERQYAGEPAVFFGQINAPESQRLDVLDHHLRNYKREPISSFGNFRRLIKLSRLPLWVRRFAWWASLNWSGAKRAKRLGTFGLSVYSGLGASSLHPISPLSFLLNYGVMDEHGRLTVRLIYDHRVVDGAVVARALAGIEAALVGPLLDELISYEHVLLGSDHDVREELLLAG